ncbi:MAG: 50S ribosomal protein L23 [Clostridia bacterium]|nr:50S ribosomal protein L23 [Clostridia bacterium]
MKAPQDIILRPVITERSNSEAGLGKYTFQVARDATKPDVRMAAEKLFGVKVLKVNTVNYDGKMKKQGATSGKTASWKKAVVTIDIAAEPATWLAKGGKSTQSSRKYKTSIEEFGFGQ